MGSQSLSREWLDFAHMDLSSAEFLLGMHPLPVEIICYHCEQAAEKFLKAVLIYYGVEAPKTHDLVLLCKLCVQLDQTWEFWVLAVAVGLCQGGIQALSRSYYGKLIPKEASNEYFGFFDIFGKFADFFGPLIISFCAFVFHSSSYGVLALILLFALGLILLIQSEKAARKEQG